MTDSSMKVMKVRTTDGDIILNFNFFMFFMVKRFFLSCISCLSLLKYKFLYYELSQFCRRQNGRAGCSL